MQVHVPESEKQQDAADQRPSCLQIIIKLLGILEQFEICSVKTLGWIASVCSYVKS